LNENTTKNNRAVSRHKGDRLNNHLNKDSSSNTKAFYEKEKNEKIQVMSFEFNGNGNVNGLNKMNLNNQSGSFDQLVSDEKLSKVPNS